CSECNDLTKTGSATATDNCDPNPTITYSDCITGTCPKSIVRTWKAKDMCGNQVTCTQTIQCIASRPCPRSPGYWKTHQSAWPATTLRVGCVTYNSTQLMNLLSDKEPGGSAANSDMSAILAKFVISATFDIMANSDPQNIQSVLSSANTWLTSYPPGTNPSGTIKTNGENIKNQLDTYVNSTPSGCTN
ncbi:MAG TPA: hypothetical protein VMV81_09615, partial [Phycisphaerae bacterium]|nr:hypothetical protein [Phycisphaerae bacterium]